MIDYFQSIKLEDKKNILLCLSEIEKLEPTLMRVDQSHKETHWSESWMRVA